MLPLAEDDTPYRLITTDGVGEVTLGDRTFLTVEPEALRTLAFAAVKDIQHLLRPGHLAQLKRILDDPEASPNDRFVALDLLKNANIAAGGVLPMCQDTGTAIVMGKRGQHVLTAGRRRARSLARDLRRLPEAQPAVLPAVAAVDVAGAQHGHEPARADRAVLEHSPGPRGPVRLPVHGQGRRQREQELPVPGDGGPAEPRVVHPLPRREAARHRHRRLPAVPPGDRHRRHQRRVRAQDGQVRQRPLLRHPAGARLRRGARLPRPRDGAAGARHDAGVRHRRAVRRQVLLP